MQLIDFQPQTGWRAALLLALGSSLILCSVLLIGINIYFSAVGMVEFTGGNAEILSADVWWPSLKVLAGGQLGLAFGLFIGGLITIVQTAFWLSSAEEWRVAAMVQWMMRAIGTYDFLSTIYYLSAGQLLDFASMEGFGVSLVRLAGRVLVTLLFLSIGAEIWLAVGIELTRVNWGPGTDAWGDFFGAVGDMLGRAEDSARGGSGRSDSRRRRASGRPIPPMPRSGQIPSYRPPVLPGGPSRPYPPQPRLIGGEEDGDDEQ